MNGFQSKQRKAKQNQEADSQTEGRQLPPTLTGPQANILALQRAAGNHAARELFHQNQDSTPMKSSLPQPFHDQVPNGGGQPLESQTRGYMERLFGQDFSKVTVHTDSQAEESASQVNAKAYTLGNSIVFGRGRYAPQTGDGKHLLAHELAHVVQQSRGGAVASPAETNHLESAADQAATTATSGSSGTITVLGASAPGIMREPLETSFGLGTPPLSLNNSLDPKLLSIEKLENEISLIRQWIRLNPGNNVENERLEYALIALENELRQKSRDADNSLNPFLRGVPKVKEFDAQVSPSSAILSYHGSRQIIMNVAPEARTAKPPFAYEYDPAPDYPASITDPKNPDRSIPIIHAGPKRKYAIIRIVAGPGVSIQFKGFPSFDIPSISGEPLVEIYRVQDPAQVPEQGKPIQPSKFQGVTAGKVSDTEIPGYERAREFRGQLQGQPLPPEIGIKQRPDGVDIIHAGASEVLAITAPNLLGDARFAYQIVPQQLVMGQMRLEVRVVKTPSVKIKGFAPAGASKRGSGLFTGIVPVVYEVDKVSEVPPQGQPISEVGRRLTSIPYEEPQELSEMLMQTAVDIGIGAIPVVGELTDLAEAATGYDKWGHRLSLTERVITGIAVLIPFVGGAALRGASRGGKYILRLGERAGGEIAGLVKAVRVLNPAEIRQVEDWTATLVVEGKRISKSDLPKVAEIVKKIDDAKSAGKVSQAGSPAAKMAGQKASSKLTSQAEKNVTQSTLASGKRARNVYPDFENIPTAMVGTAQDQATRLSTQLGQNIPKDRVLSAPWIGTVQDAAGKRRSVATSQGWLRNENRFWKKWKEAFPEDAKLLGKGNTVTPELAKKYGWPTSGPNNAVGQKLIHHHIDNGTYTVAIPESWHEKMSRAIHAVPEVLGKP